MKKIFFTLCFLVTFSVIAAQDSSGLSDSKIIETPLVSPTSNEKARFAYNKGSELLKAGDFDNAIKLLLEAVKEDPNYTDAMDHLGIAYRNLKKYDEAVKWYKKSISIKPESTAAYINLALVYSLQGKNQESIDTYKKIIELEPDNPEGYYGIGRVYFINRDYEESISYTDKAIQKYLDQGSSYIYDALFMQGLNFYNISNWKEALKCFEILVRVYPEDAKIKKIHNEIMTKIKKDETASDSTSVK